MPTSSSSAAATSACGRRGTSSSSSPSWTSCCSRPPCAATVRVAATAGSASRCGATHRRCATRPGDAAALATCRASEEAVRGIGAWCAANGVDAWFREAPMLRVATTESQMGTWDDIVRTAAELGAPDEVVVGVRRRRTGSLRVSALSRRGALPSQRHRAPGPAGSRAPREAPRARCPYPRAHCGDAARSPRERGDAHGARTARMRPSWLSTRLPPASPATACRSRSLRVTSSSPSRCRTCSTSSAGRAARRSSTAARSCTTCARRVTDGSSSAGAAAPWEWEAARPTASSSTGDVIAETERALRRFFPQTRGRAVTHAWGGPIDVSPTHLPIFGSRGRVHHGFGFTGKRRRAVVPRRRDPRSPRARPPRRAHAARSRRTGPQALPARAAPLRRRLAHPARR